MASLKETAAELAYRITMHETMGYGTLKAIAKSGGHKAPELLAEVLRLCREHGIDAGHLTATTPLNLRYKLGMASPPKREPRMRTIPGAGMEFTSAKDREEWARGQGYSSWGHYYEKERKEEHVRKFLELYIEMRRKGHADAEERAKSLLGKRIYVPKTLIRDAEERAGLAKPKARKPGSVWVKKLGKH